jgi:CheY-like chemotaxis protein
VRRIVDEMLRSWAMSPTSVAGVDEALESIAKAQRAGRPYRLVVTDDEMPQGGGFALVEALRRNGDLPCPVVMLLSTSNRPEAALRCEQMGVAARLLKPVGPSELFNAIVGALGPAPSAPALGPAQSEEPPKTLRPLRVLLAEDSHVNQVLAQRLLEKQGHQVVAVRTGRDAVAAVRSQAVDLVLMDVEMPEMDGFEATRILRAAERDTGSHVPIVALTARAMRGDREQCLDAGFDGYVAKPIRAEQLYRAIEETLAAVEASPKQPRSQ